MVEGKIRLIKMACSPTSLVERYGAGVAVQRRLFEMKAVKSVAGKIVCRPSGLPEPRR
jgi:hypothetical protein